LSTEEQQPRVPTPIKGIQVNFCKNPSCMNFGISASTEKQQRGPIGPAGKERDLYTLVSSRPGTVTALHCRECGEYPTLKSNLAITEELNRALAYIAPVMVSCPNKSCSNHAVDIVGRKQAYHSFGRTKSGSRRYRCKLCKTTFAVPGATTGQKKPHKNIQVFQLLVNKMPFKRICEAAGISMPAVYDKIDFLHRQCQAFVANREKRLLAGLPIRRLYVGVDRQDYVVNWTNAADKRNVVLHAVGSADNTTGYVFGLHLNFDPSMDAATVEKDAVDSGDYNLKYPFRKYARLWLKEDYYDALRNRLVRKKRRVQESLMSEIESAYEDAISRDDIEVSEEQDIRAALPSKGMQIHAEYTLYGHFFFLKQMFSGVNKVRFFLDQDSGMRAACLSAFADEVKQGICDAFFVRVNAHLTVNERRQALSDSRKEWEHLRQRYPDYKDSALRLMIIKSRMQEVLSLGKWQDRWIYHPFPNMSEPEKAICYLTDTGKYDEDHLAWLYNKASLHAIDRFFMQIRRRLSLLERPIATSSNVGRKWHGYSAYNPGIITKVLDIFRVFYNYVEVGKDGQTPAVRLGLAKSKVDMEDIIYYA
jgi:transposase-like protein